MEIIITDTGDLRRAAREFIDQMGNDRIFAFYGAMGAGKTTFIKAVSRELGSVDVAKSPSFTIINEYVTADGDVIYHFDFFRIEKPEEAYDFGIEEYLQSDNICLMEWPERIEELLPDETVRIHIRVQEDGSRVLKLRD